MDDIILAVWVTYGDEMRNIRIVVNIGFEIKLNSKSSKPYHIVVLASSYSSHFYGLPHRQIVHLGDICLYGEAIVCGPPVNFFVLQSKLRELEKRCALQNVLYEELGLEMSSVQKQASRSKSGVNLTSSEVQTSPESETSTPDSALSSSVRMVNGEGSRFALQQQQQKPRLGTQKTDSGLGTNCTPTHLHVSSR